MPEKLLKCTCCNQEINDSFLTNSHKVSVEHQFNFYLWAYNKLRKSLAKDKDGIRLEVMPHKKNQLQLNLGYEPNKGKYFLKVNPNQLKPSKGILEFRCCLYNDRKEDDMFLTAARILDANSFSSLYDDKENWIETGKFIKIKAKEKYNGVVIKCKLESDLIGSFKIPFALNLQTENGATDITLCRTLVVSVIDWEEEPQELVNSHLSPFTDQPWDTNVRIIPPFRKRKFLNNYPIPQKYYIFFKRGFQEWKTMKPDEIGMLKNLRKQMEPEKVTSKNYANYFHYCLWLEEIVNVLMLGRYNMENVTMTVIDDDYLQLEVPGLAEKRPSLVAGDHIRIRIHNDHTGYEGFIKTVEDRHIIIELIHDELLNTICSIPGLEMDVAFQLGRLPLERAHEGVDQVCSKKILKWLFPDEQKIPNMPLVYKLSNGDFLNKNIIDNQEQKTAVEKILNCTSRSAPYIVFGPPGTGKTVTIVEAIYQILKKTDKKILVCAPANAACDMLASKLIPFCDKKELLRVHSETRDRSTISKELRGFSNMTPGGDFIPVGSKDLKKKRIVITTLILIGKFATGEYHPDCVFIDEAAQAQETDACVALAAMRSGGQIVLAGDPQQLGPIVMSNVAEKYGLSISLLQRLMDTQNTYKTENTNFITMLKKNFRSHSTILQIPNRRFYDNKLNAVSEEPRLDPLSKFDVYLNNKVSGQAMEFCAVSAKERREGRSPSYFNPAEANMVVKYIKTLVGLQLGQKYKVKLSDIGVITPYIRQVYKIKNLLKSNHFNEVEVGSTEAFQGREKRIIIISTVRAQHDLLQHDKKYALGFVKQDKRFNVAITRAISKLIVIGCPTVLATDEKWREYMETCKRMNSYHGVQFEERTKDRMAKIIETFKGLSVDKAITSNGNRKP